MAFDGPVIGMFSFLKLYDFVYLPKARSVRPGRGRVLRLANAVQQGKLSFGQIPLRSRCDTINQSFFLLMPSLQALAQESRQLLKAGQSMNALRVAEQAAQLYAADAEAHYLHGHIQEMVARYEEALHSYREAIRLGGHKDAGERAAHLAAALERPTRPLVPTGLRSWHCGVPFDTLTTLQNALHNYKYKGVPLQKNPFDYALYPMLLWEMKPRTIIEIGSKEGGSALWMGDLCDAFNLDCQIHSIDIVKVATVKHKRVTFHEGDGRNLGGTLTEKVLKKWPRPWLVIEDADHSFETSIAALDFFEDKLEMQDMMVVEDGIITDLSQLPEGGSGPHRALRKFLQRNYAEWEIRSEWCDFFGYNFTWCTNGFLKRTGLKKLGQDVAPELPELISKVKSKDFAGALAQLDALIATGKHPRGTNYLRAYCLWRRERLPEARDAAEAEVREFPDHEQSRRLGHLLSSRVSGTIMEMPTAPVPRLPAPQDSESLYKINLGCGRRFHSEWLNFDVAPSDSSVIAHDLQKPLPLEDATCDVVYHSHVLEHLPKAQAPAFIAECFRVLAPGGVLRVAVPDLENIARQYLRQLDLAATGDEQAADRHAWMTLEMVDQLARHRSGGEMLEHWKQPTMPEEEFVVQRLGHEVSGFLDDFRSKPKKTAPPAPMTADSVGRFRLSGEVHQWMYDRVSLGRLLTDAGFADARVCGPAESSIEGFARFQLDADESGHPWKPDSLFVEARKPAP